LCFLANAFAFEKISPKPSPLLCFSACSGCIVSLLCVLLPLEKNLLWAKLRDYVISRVNPNPRQVFLVRVVKM